MTAIPATPAVPVRHCARCKRHLPLSAYYKGVTDRNGWCKACKAAWTKADYIRKQAQYDNSATLVCSGCRKELPRSEFTRGQSRCHPCKAASNKTYYARRRAHKWPNKLPKPKPAPKPQPKPQPKPVFVSNTHAVTRNAGRIPVLYGCKMGGEHACYIFDGVDTGPTCRHVVDAVAAWNAL